MNQSAARQPAPWPSQTDTRLTTETVLMFRPDRNVRRDLSNRVGRLSATEMRAYQMLADTAPLIELGSLVIPRSVQMQIPRSCVWFAIDMHQRGYWGRVTDVDFERNERAIRDGGMIVSIWTFQEAPAFWLRTERLREDHTTTAFLDVSAAST